MLGTTTTTITGSSSSFTRFTFLASFIMLAMNIILLTKTASNTTNTTTTTFSNHIRIGSEFFSTVQAAIEETVSIHDRSSGTTTTTTMTQAQPQTTNSHIHGRPQQNQQQYRYPRVLMGIFSSDSYNDATYRSRHRKLMWEIWKDSRVCNVHQFLHNATVRSNCQLLYTFVIGGANPNQDAPTELLEDTPSNPLTLSKMDAPTRDDVNQEDVTLLNIRSVYFLMSFCHHELYKTLCFSHASSHHLFF
jgi:hypothetical protein